MSDLSKSAIFPLGQENTAYAQYFIGKSYLNMISTQEEYSKLPQTSKWSET